MSIAQSYNSINKVITKPSLKFLILIIEDIPHWSV